MIRTTPHFTPFEIAVLLITFLIVVGITALIFSETTTTTFYLGSPSQDEIKARAEIQAKWDEMIDAIRNEDEERIEELSRWLDEHAGTSFEQLEGTKARLICAWCTLDMGEANTSEDTHGICEPCKSIYFPPK